MIQTCDHLLHIQLNIYDQICYVNVTYNYIRMILSLIFACVTGQLLALSKIYSKHDNENFLVLFFCNCNSNMDERVSYKCVGPFFLNLIKKLLPWLVHHRMSYFHR